MDNLPEKQGQNEIVIYQLDDNTPQITVRLNNETMWLSQQQIADLFQTSRTNVVEHIDHIYSDEELDRSATCRNFRQVRIEGNRQVEREIPFFNLDIILAVGYRIKSRIATNFRIWATERLKEYIIKGFTMDDERLKGTGGGNYWKELLGRIRDIRSSEKALYRQVLDLYATSRDYEPKSKESIQFFKTVQNKLHYATNQQTAAELISTRADAEKDFMGLTTFAGTLPTLKEVTIAKNYLTEDELFRLNRLVSAFFDLAEIKANEHTPMYMKDWVAELDKFSGIYGKGVLQDAGHVSHDQAMNKAISEYKKYQAKTLTPVEHAYLETIKVVQKKIAKKE